METELHTSSNSQSSCSQSSTPSLPSHDSINSNKDHSSVESIETEHPKASLRFELDLSKPNPSPSPSKLAQSIYSEGGLSPYFGSNDSPAFQEKEEIKKRVMVMNFVQKTFKRMTIPIIFCSVLTILIVTMYLFDWKDNYADLYSSKTTVFLVVFIIMMFILLLEICHAGIVLMTSVAVLLYSGVISRSEAFSGFSDSGTMTVLAVCILSDAINRTGGLAMICNYILPRKIQKWYWPTIIRFVPVFALASIFLNNTPIVAMGISIMLSTSKTTRIPLSKLLMPMQISVVIGGICSLIGTSSNMVAKGLLDSAIEELNEQGVVNIDYSMSLFETGYVALFLLIPSAVYLIFFGSWLLPSNKKEDIKQEQHNFVIPITIIAHSPLIGKKLGNTPLANFSNTPVPQIIRDNEIINDLPLKVGDTLLYIAEPSTLTEMLMIKGISFEDPTASELIRNVSADNLSLYEVSFSENSPFNNHCFPSLYEGHKFGLLGISNDGNNLESAQTQPLFFSSANASASYLVVTEKSFTRSPDYPLPFRIAYELPQHLPFHYPLWKAIIAVFSLIIPIILDICGLYKIVSFAFLSIALLVITGVMTVKQVYNAVSVPLICTLGASFGLSAAMTNTNTGQMIALTLVKVLEPLGKIGILFGIAIPTMLLTQVLSNNATVAVMFPIVWSMYTGADSTGATRGENIGIRSSVVCMTICCSCCFLLPFGYQTNLMVMKDGNYNVKTFLCYGIFMSLLYLVGSVGLSYLVFEVLLDPV
ncbi:Sodium/sulfate symporter [Entamoeba marina]